MYMISKQNTEISMMMYMRRVDCKPERIHAGDE
jgi:hypothetical protein